jgi:FkbM family methyltransferase
LVFFTVGAARKLISGKVLSVEPSQSAFERLSRNVIRNGVGDRVLLIQSAMSDRSEARTLSVIPGMEEYSSFSVDAHTDKSPTAVRINENVVTSTVDEMVDNYNLNPAVMKVDVEGAEDLVFSGALKTLRRFRPVVFAELSPELLSKMGADAAQVVKRFTDLGYSGFNPERPGAPLVRPEGANVVFVPGR